MFVLRKVPGLSVRGTMTVTTNSHGVGVINNGFVKEESDGNVLKKDADLEFLDSQVTIPDDENVGFSFRKLWAFTGPGLLMSIAFLDPGNIEADLQSGGQFGYQLLWVLFWATFLGLLVQRLSIRVGVVSGKHMAELCYTEYRPVWRILIWIMMEVAIIGSDMQEVIGTAISIYLLTLGNVPVWAGVLITVLETLTFVFLDKYGLRKLELFFAFLIATMAVTFGFEFFVSNPDYLSIAEGVVIPRCENKAIQSAVGIVGACIMPHNLYLHSGLVKTRIIDRSNRKKVSEANLYYFIESAISLFISFIINLFVMAVFAEGIFNKTNQNVHDLCHSKESSFWNPFPTDNKEVEIDTSSGGKFLGCRFGTVALIIWAIGILAAGQSSTMTGCYAGQFTMEGFLNLSWVRWKRVLFTRSMALLPTLFASLQPNLTSMSELNDILNNIMSFQLPFAMLPVIAFSSNQVIMKEFANGICNKILAVGMFVLIMAGNVLSIYNLIMSKIIGLPIYLHILLIIFAIVYLTICCYLMLHTAAALTSPQSKLNTSQFMQRYILGKSMTATTITGDSNVNITTVT